MLCRSLVFMYSALASIFQLGECQVLVSWGCTCTVGLVYSALSPVLYGDIRGLGGVAVRVLASNL